MSKLSLLVLLLMFWPGLLGAQPGNQGSTTSATTISGCLEFSSHAYGLVDDKGESVRLRYQANKLIHYVGHNVTITGNSGIETIDTTVDGLASSADEIPVFNVDSVKSAGGTCPQNP